MPRDPAYGLLDPSKWRGQIGRAARFGPRDWAVIVEAMATLVAIRVALRWSATPRLLSWASRVRPNAVPPSAARIRRVAWLADVAGRRLLSQRCLPRALAVARVLSRRGVASQVRVGVRRADDRFGGHAWVEWNGLVLNDSGWSVATYVPIDDALRDGPGR